MAISWLRWDSHLEKSLVDKFVVISHVFFTSVVNVHLQGKEGQLELLRDESKRFGGVLLPQIGCIRPSALS